MSRKLKTLTKGQMFLWGGRVYEPATEIIRFPGKVEAWAQDLQGGAKHHIVLSGNVSVKLVAPVKCGLPLLSLIDVREFKEMAMKIGRRGTKVYDDRTPSPYDVPGHFHKRTLRLKFVGKKAQEELEQAINITCGYGEAVAYYAQSGLINPINALRSIKLVYMRNEEAE